MVLLEFKEVYPRGEVERVRVVHDETVLEGVVKSYNATKRELEDLTDDYTSKLNRRKQVKRVEVWVGKWLLL